MKNLFTKVIDGNNYKFERVEYGLESFYNVVTTDENKQPLTFRLKKDEEGVWSIQAQALPMYIHELGLKLHDAIEDADEQ